MEFYILITLGFNTGLLGLQLWLFFKFLSWYRRYAVKLEIFVRAFTQYLNEQVKVIEVEEKKEEEQGKK